MLSTLRLLHLVLTAILEKMNSPFDGNLQLSHPAAPEEAGYADLQGAYFEEDIR